MKSESIIAQISIILTLIILLLAVLSVDAEEAEKNIEPEYYTEYTVVAGDTLWNIVKNNSNGYGKYDTRKIIDDLKERNNCSSTIYQGQVIEIPQY